MTEDKFHFCEHGLYKNRICIRYCKASQLKQITSHDTSTVLYKMFSVVFFLDFILDKVLK